MTALVLKETGRVVGDICVAAPDPAVAEREELRGKRGATMSFSLYRALRRKGLMSEALTAVLDELFRDDKLDFVHSGYFSFNDASAALQRKLGFRELFRQHIERGGETVETVENVLFRENR